MFKKDVLRQVPATIDVEFVSDTDVICHSPTGFDVSINGCENVKCDSLGIVYLQGNYYLNLHDIDDVYNSINANSSLLIVLEQIHDLIIKQFK